jgi:hypothetical protein
MLTTDITIIAVIVVFIFFIMILLKFNVIEIDPIKRKNVKVKSKEKSYKIFISDEGGIPITSRKFYKPDLLYYTNIYPRNPDKLIAVFAGTFLAAGTTAALAGRAPGEIAISATISSLVATMMLLR